jgi:hypothetical protein
MIDLGVIGVVAIIFTANKKDFFALGIIERSQVQKAWSFVLTPLVHAACFRSNFRASSPKRGAFAGSHSQDVFLQLMEDTACRAAYV